MKTKRRLLSDDRQQQKRRWWRSLDLFIALLVVNSILGFLAFSSQRVALPDLPQKQGQQTNFTGLATLTAPLESLFIHGNTQVHADPCGGVLNASQYAQCVQEIVEHCKGDPTSSQCADLAQACKASSDQLQECLDGITGRNTYTQKDPKIQNPISKGSPLFYFTPYEITIANNQVDLIWGALLGIVDVFLVLVLMLNGLHIILAGSVFRYAQAVESLPGVLLAIIAAHISLTFMISMLTVGNSMTQGIYTFTLSNPNIHRSPSGFKDGGKTQDLYLHVFFPSYSEQGKARFNGNPNITYQEAAQKWGVPQTEQDLKQFNDQVCTWESTNFDSNMRSRIFGRNGDYHNGGLYQLFKQRNDLLDQYDGNKVPAGVQTQLDNILTQIDSDMQKLSSGSDRLAWYNDAFVKQDSWDQQMDDAWNKYGQDIPEAEKNRLGDDGQGRGGEAMLRANIHKLLAGVPPHEGDLIQYSCQHDATGEDFQLVPDDLNFKDLFQNLQDLTSGLPMIVKVLSLMLLAQMIVRLFFINLYIVTAPIGIACWALPGKVGQSVTRLWLQGFLSTVLVQFIMVVALIVIQVLLGDVLKFVGDDPNPPIGGLDDGTLRNIMRVACLWFIIRIPSLFGSAPMRTMAAAGEMMGQAVGTTVASQVARAQMIAQAVTSFIGLALAR